MLDRYGLGLHCFGVSILRMRRCQSMELARYYQRLENIEKRRKENERYNKNSIVARLVRRLGILCGVRDR